MGNDIETVRSTGSDYRAAYVSCVELSMYREQVLGTLLCW